VAFARKFSLAVTPSGFVRFLAATASGMGCGTRVALDRIVVAFKSGATAEEIAQQFPTVELRDVYLIIGHYLSYTDEIDAYLSQRQSEAAQIQRDIEKKFNPVGIRARLLARRDAKSAG
jgi:uncharacterized protein (DUF433 family)